MMTLAGAATTAAAISAQSATGGHTCCTSFPSLFFLSKQRKCLILMVGGAIAFQKLFFIAIGYCRPPLVLVVENQMLLLLWELTGGLVKWQVLFTYWVVVAMLQPACSFPPLGSFLLAYLDICGLLILYFL